MTIYQSLQRCWNDEAILDMSKLAINCMVSTKYFNVNNLYAKYVMDPTQVATHTTLELSIFTTYSRALHSSSL